MNYLIENNLNWKDLLNNIDDIEDNNKYCLISGLELTDGHITLPCNHSFNYFSIYNEIINQKQKRSNLETQKLKFNQIKCPYCRTIYNNLIPYYKSPNINKIAGINSPEKSCFKLNNCEYLYNYGKKKGSLCAKCAFPSKNGFFCNKHINNIQINQINQNNQINQINLINQNNQNNDISLNIISKNNEINYKKLTIPFLKDILRKNNCKVGGNKSILIERILTEKNKNPSIWEN